MKVWVVVGEEDPVWSDNVIGVFLSEESAKEFMENECWKYNSVYTEGHEVTE